VSTVLVTSGGTREPIDGVRCIANFSSGRTGAVIADAFAAAGWHVVHVRASDAVAATNPAVTVVPYGSVADLDEACRAVLGGAEPVQCIVHAAAVSDFVVAAVVVDGVRHDAPLVGKLDSAKELSVELVPAPKILPRLKSYSASVEPVLVGFKLTNGAGAQERQAAVDAQFERSSVDLVVHNDLTEMDHRADRHAATIRSRAGIVATVATNAELAAALIHHVSALVAVDRR
jgi:phosphopantothenoylcysteine synthetase/decarboxylase